MTPMLELSDKYFKTALIQIFQWAITNVREDNEKNRKSQQKNWRYKEEPNGNI